jgi:site-specific DNA-methyltransferase (cytosine-N4-specific)
VPQFHIPILIGGDARRIPLADGTVQCVPTSPPYWGLRKYDGAQHAIWGGDPNCEHQWGQEKKVRQSPQRDHAPGGGFAQTRGNETARRGMAFEASLGSFCELCPAWKGAYGLEPTPDLYVAHSIEILRENRRVLKSDGVVCWNVDDSRNKKKGFSLVPERLLLAAEADGWFVRSKIIWHKENPMPESVKDRPTDAYELIYVFAKSKRYYWDAGACREPATSKDAGPDGMRNMRNVWKIPLQPSNGEHCAPFPEELARRCISMASKPGDLILDPFGGSGTTGKVAMELGRRSVLLDINYTGEGSYERVARERFQKFLDCGTPTLTSAACVESLPTIAPS